MNRNLFFETIVEMGAVALAWVFFDWKLALIIFLVFWARNLKISNRK